MGVFPDSFSRLDKWGRELGRPLTCGFGLDGGIDTEGIHKLHETVKVVLLSHNIAGVHEMNQSLDQAYFDLRKDDADVFVSWSGWRVLKQ